MRTRAFTLVEILVVVAILLTLAALLYVVLAPAREAANKTVCLSNLKQIGLALGGYILDYRGVEPAPGVRTEYYQLGLPLSLITLVDTGAITDRRVLLCPYRFRHPVGAYDDPSTVSSYYEQWWDNSVLTVVPELGPYSKFVAEHMVPVQERRKDTLRCETCQVLWEEGRAHAPPPLVLVVCHFHDLRILDFKQFGIAWRSGTLGIQALTFDLNVKQGTLADMPKWQTFKEFQKRPSKNFGDSEVKR